MEKGKAVLFSLLMVISSLAGCIDGEVSSGSDYEQQIADMEQNQNMTNQRISEMEEALVAEQNENDWLRISLTETERELVDLEATIIAQQQENNELVTSLERLRQTILQMNQTIADLRRGNENASSTDNESDSDDGDDPNGWLDEQDGGYTYASDVDNHRLLMWDICDIKSAASENDWAEAKRIYENGKNAEKDDGSYRALAMFASSAIKNHAYDSYYNESGSIDTLIRSALEGTGDFEGASDSVRYQGIARLTANMGMVAYTIHELNTAVNKADAGNVDNNSGAPHNWDEAWAFFHGPDEFYACSPARSMQNRALDFGTVDDDGVATTFAATEAAMINGLSALQANDAAGYNAAVDTIMKNIIIAYSQAVLKYAQYMDSDTDAERYQAMGYTHWKTMEAYAAPFMDDGCYNIVVHRVTMMGVTDSSACDAFIWTNGQQDPNGEPDTCYNTVTHAISTDATTETECSGYDSMYFQDDYGARKINEIFALKDASQLGTSYDVAPFLQPVWDQYGITAADIGTLT